MNQLVCKRYDILKGCQKGCQGRGPLSWSLLLDVMCVASKSDERWKQSTLVSKLGTRKDFLLLWRNVCERDFFSWVICDSGFSGYFDSSLIFFDWLHSKKSWSLCRGVREGVGVLESSSLLRGVGFKYFVTRMSFHPWKRCFLFKFNLLSHYYY